MRREEFMYASTQFARGERIDLQSDRTGLETKKV
jgi:hypothetical protein